MSALVPPVTADDLSRGLESLGLSAASAEVHSSLSSFGQVQGGAHAVARSLTGVLDTTLVPAFCWDASCPPPPGSERIRRNAMGPDYLLSLPSRPKAFDPASSAMDRGMGQIPAALRALPESRRSAHPLNSWVAVGSKATYMVGPYDPEDPYRPLKRLEEADGFILLMGVGLNSCTAIHLAEEKAGRGIFLRWAQSSGGKAIRVRTGTCSRGFDRLKPALWGLGREIPMGSSSLWAARLGPLVEAAALEIKKNPSITVCGPLCDRCRDAAAGGPIEG